MVQVRMEPVWDVMAPAGVTPKFWKVRLAGSVSVKTNPVAPPPVTVKLMV